MNFKEALIAHLQGEKVEMCTNGRTWMGFGYGASHVSIREIEEFSVAGFMYRPAPRTIFVNGVEVPAPESKEPEYGADCFIPMPTYRMSYEKMVWTGDQNDRRLIDCGLIYLNKEDAIARAKAMLLTSDK